MAHALDMTRGRAAMAYAANGGAPWHGLGAALQPGLTIEEWTQAAGMDWKVQRAMVRFATSREMANGAAADLRTMDDKVVLFRSDTHAALGMVSDSYKVVQPREVMEFFRDLTEEAGMTLETAGCLHGGKRFWALAKIGVSEGILDANDKVGGYVLLSTSADGSLATEGRFTSIRVVCQNTLSFARSDSKASVRVTHRSEFDAVKAKKEMGLNVSAVRERFAAEMDTFRRLASTKLDQKEMVRLTLELIAGDSAKLDAMSQEEKVTLAAKPAAATIGTMASTGRGLIGANLAGGNGTAWSWLNAVTQYVDHAARARSQDNRLDSAWFGRGDALKSKALEMVVERVGGSSERLLGEQPQAEGGSILDAVIANGVAG
jgi:phage/plasmid-like protein (TIGR03299 family)